MVDVDVLKAQLVRQDVNQSWGFRLHGGLDLNQPLTIIAILPGSPAAKIGLEVGDEVVEVGETETATLTHQQALDLIESHANTILMTVERRVSGCAQPQHVVSTSSLTLSPPSVKSYQPMNMTGSSRPATHLNHTQVLPIVDYRTVTARPFEAATASRAAPSPRLYETVRQQSPMAAAAHSNNSSSLQAHYPQYIAPDDYDETVTALRRVRYNSPPADRYSACPQSRTFKMLQTVMHNEEPAAGVSGLPPPRSATMEHMRQHRQQPPAGSAISSQRVKVFMPQQYNSPMGMYSAHNVLETFTAQAESMLDTMEKRQTANSAANEYYSNNN